MIKLAEKTLCTGCLNCVLNCKYGAITVRRDVLDNVYPFINESKCISCGRCMSVCPELYKPVFNDDFNQRKAFVGWSTDRKIRKQSASGGIATAVSMYFVEDGGCQMVWSLIQMERHIINCFLLEV